ncbi:MAG: hypothetical protein WA908_06215, partial [Pontixanthobacter sp.]
MGEFVETMRTAIGPKITIPEPLVAYFEWIESEGLVRQTETDPPETYALIDPSCAESCLAIEVPVAGELDAWAGDDGQTMDNRLAAFCRTGGDGSRAALWLDDNGETQIVHLGSGSGSTSIGIMVDEPLDFLRALAIGYDELCWPDNHDRTPLEIWE